ncbi:hypothetical protein [Cyanobium sp. NIES-981]|uniref:hypothetical protein n=1 Tax=Cyanobium sp. NIES-981 TaxID=1851505 RepID=UPI00350F8880
MKPEADTPFSQGWAGFSANSYKALSGERSPSFDTILRVVAALGLKLSASVRSEAEVT